MTAAVQLQRELLETILEEKTERMQAIEALVDTIAALRQDNAELKRIVADLQRSGTANNATAAPAPNSPDGEGLQDLKARMDAMESAMVSPKEVGRQESPTMGGRAGSEARSSAASAPPSVRPGSVVDDEEALEQAQAEDAEAGAEKEYELKESMWDLAVLIGLPGMGVLGSAHAAVLLIANITIQAVFCLLALFNFTQPEFDDGTIGEVEAWRIGTAHDYTHIDPLTNKALRTRVCGEDSSLYISSGQLDMFTQIISYLPEFDNEELEGLPNWSIVTTMRKEFNGVWMCLLAVSCYHLSIMRELHSIWDKVKVFSVIPRGHTTLLSSKLMFKRIAVARYISILVIAFIRLVLVISLFYTGTLFLVHDIGVADLLLNAVALEFVLNVDELIFESLAPVSGKLFMSKIQALEVPHSRLRYKGMDMRSVFFTLLVPIAVGYTWAVELDPMVTQVKEAYEIMCDLSGQDFVYQTTLDGFVAISPSTSDSDDSDAVTYDSDGNPDIAGLFKDLQKDAVHKIVYGTELLPCEDATCASDTTGQYSQLIDMPQWGTLTFEDLTERYGDACEDSWESTSGIFRQVRWLLTQLFELGADYQDRTLTGCEDLADLCFAEATAGAVSWRTLARFICPGTCGCRELVGRFSYIPNNEQGCSETCMDFWADGDGEYDLSNPSLTCADWSTEALQATSWWLGWTEQDWAQAYGQGNITSSRATGVLYDDGCNAIPVIGVDVNSINELSQDSDYILLCYGGLASEYDETHVNKPLVAVCPERCGCKIDPSLGANSLQSQVAVYRALVNDQGVQCPVSCTSNDLLACSNFPDWVCSTDSNSEEEDDYIFVSGEAYSAWDASCTRDGPFNIFDVQHSCYDCASSSPTWLCNEQSSQLQMFMMGGSPTMPYDIWVYKNHEATRALGSSTVEYYAYCELNTTDFQSVNQSSTAYQSWYTNIARMCYQWMCDMGGNQICNYCSNDFQDVNDRGWTFNCTSNTQGGGQNQTAP